MRGPRPRPSSYLYLNSKTILSISWVVTSQPPNQGATIVCLGDFKDFVRQLRTAATATARSSCSSVVDVTGPGRRTAAGQNLVAALHSLLSCSSGLSLVDGFKKNIIWTLNDVAQDEPLPAETKLVLNTDAPNKVMITEEGERILHVRNSHSTKRAYGFV